MICKGKSIGFIGVARGGESGHAPLPKFLENIVILCFERRFSRQTSVVRLKSNILAPPNFLAPPKFLGWLRHWLDCHGFQRNHKVWLHLLSKQGRTQLIYSAELTTEHAFENFGEIARLLLPLIAGSASKTCQHHLETRAANVWDLVQSDQ